MDNLGLYNSNRTVPEDALKSIAGGRIKGFSDINAQWRIEKLTEMFGPIGIGWYYEIVERWLEECPNGETAAFVDIHLYYCDPESGEWSKPIYGIGGNMFVSNESKGIYVSDECFKMALTDAISVCCKQIGIGADVYRNKDIGSGTKYDKKDIITFPIPIKGTEQVPKIPAPNKTLSDAQVKRLWAIAKSVNRSNSDVHTHVLDNYGKTSINDLTIEEYNKVCDTLESLKSTIVKESPNG